MGQTHVALALFFVLFAIVLPLIIKKYKIKDDIKMPDTLPVGTAQFRAFLKLTVLIIVGLAVLALVLNSLDLLGIQI